jgi:hypothetical protein
LANHRDVGKLERCDEGLELGIDEKEAGAAVLEDVLDFGACQPVVDCDQDSAGGGNREVRLEHRR